MAATTRLNDRILRGEKIMPWVIKQIWQRRDIWNTGEERLKRLLILKKFLEEDVARHSTYEGNELLKDYFHPSSAGTCLRALWFNRIGAPEDVSLDVEKHCVSQRRFETGDHYHFRYAVLFDYLGILKEREKPFILHDQKMCGKCDSIVEVEGERFLVDIKSAAPRYFNEMCRNNSPGAQYEMQLQIYMNVLGVKNGAIITECKETHQVREFPIPASEEAFKYALERKDTLHKHLGKLTIPDREGNSISAPPCSWCCYLNTCYIDEKVRACVKAEKERRREKNAETKTSPKTNKFARAVRKRA